MTKQLLIFNTINNRYCNLMNQVIKFLFAATGEMTGNKQQNQTKHFQPGACGRDVIICCPEIAT